MSFDDLLIHSLYIKTATSSQNSLGEWISTYTTSTTATSCRMNPLSAAEMVQMQGRYDDVRYKCYLTYSTSLNRGDRILYESEEYRVKDIHPDSSGHHKTAYLVLL